MSLRFTEYAAFAPTFALPKRLRQLAALLRYDLAPRTVRENQRWLATELLGVEPIPGGTFAAAWW